MSDTMAEKVMVDAMGNQVPVRYVSAYDRTRDRVCRRIASDWKKQRKGLEDLMHKTLAGLAEIVDARKDAGHELALRGNVQVSSFDGLITVNVEQRYDIHLDDRVKAARDRLYEYASAIAGKLEGDDRETLIKILDETFRASSDGRISTNRVLALIRMEVKAAAWKQAIAMLVQSIETRRGKRYVRVTVRADRDHDAEAIRLDVADCWPEEKTEVEG